MKSSLWLANLGFVPRGVSAALLFLRITLGGALVALHGWGKFTAFPALVSDFPDPLGLGRHFTLIVTVAAELFLGLMLMAGILTRLVSALLIIFMLVIFFRVHGGAVSAPGAELSLLYVFGLGALLLAGGGSFSADEARGPYSLAGLGALGGLIAGYPVSYFLQRADYQAVVPLGQYLTGPGAVLRDESLRNTALITWGSAVLVLALAGYLIGRAMNRRTVAADAVESPPEAHPRYSDSP